MDLKSMLNDSAAQRPPSLQTPKSSYDSRVIEKNTNPESHSRAQSHPQPTRQVAYPPPLQPVDSRGPGRYLGQQSPHPNHLNSASPHASTPTSTHHPAYARSPGGPPQPYTPRDSAGHPGAYNTSFVPSPSLSVTQPPTPGSVYPHPSQTPLSAHSQTGPPLPYGQSQSPRGSNLLNGQPRHVSPNSQHQYPHPATPLGPPIIYNKISPQTQRPPSQGPEHHYRKSSYGSVGSVHGRDHSSGPQQLPENVQRQSIPEIERVKERERSVSVSPKTIPQPSPYRQLSVSSQAGSQGRSSIHSPPEMRTMSNISEVQPTGGRAAYDIKSEFQQTPTPRSSAIPAEPPVSQSRDTSVKQESIEVISSPTAQPNLKRNASFMSDQSQTSQQPRKRLKREDVPIFARSARTKPLRLRNDRQWTQPSRPTEQPPSNASQQVPQQLAKQTPPQTTQQLPTQNQPKHEATSVVNGKPQGNIPVKAVRPESGWEPTIANIAPYEDLTRRVCDWFFQCIGSAVPPSGGAMFEIEAKIGAITDIDTKERLSIPVESEAIFHKPKYHGRTKFESSMNAEQHKLLNEYLNEVTRQAFLQAQEFERSEILYEHRHEIDEFFELTPEGRANLNPSLAEYMGRKIPRVRRTIDQNTGQLKAQIVKTRVADLEIYNPNADFDCRISISVESPWDGNPHWLVALGAESPIRKKDRMSYRHMAYQVDLTQVTHHGKKDTEHELEVEISTEQIRKELDNLQNGRPSIYEDLVKGLIDNVRLLCRKGSVGGPRRS